MRDCSKIQRQFVVTPPVPGDWRTALVTPRKLVLLIKRAVVATQAITVQFPLPLSVARCLNILFTQMSCYT